MTEPPANSNRPQRPTIAERAANAGPRVQRSAAWGVHIFTATGVVFAFLALLAVYHGNPRETLMWLGIALIVDGVDGPLARMFRVKDVLPRVDGSALDLVVDYFTYVVVPAAFMHEFGMFPAGTSIAACALVLATSLYIFANLDMKTSDNYFTGFPAIWNIVALVFFVTSSPPLLNLVLTAAFCVMTFSKLKFSHPLRVREYRVPTLVMSLVWLASAAWLVFVYPERPQVVLLAFALSSAYFALLVGLRSFRGPSGQN
ncbi:MAG TPA: hypothetical protein PLA85_01575 [Micropepsaceae bacterium]|nr:hypothetical protein [Micropepsaceae bacterium]HRK70247.1 hypothetical protein [Micropepsaceae bacterium]